MVMLNLYESARTDIPADCNFHPYLRIDKPEEDHLNFPIQAHTVDLPNSDFGCLVIHRLGFQWAPYTSWS